MKGLNKDMLDEIPSLSDMQDYMNMNIEVLVHFRLNWYQLVQNFLFKDMSSIMWKLNVSQTYSRNKIPVLSIHFCILNVISAQ